jgi:hypothetical protein
MRTSNLALCTTESHRPVRRHARADRNRLVAIAEIIALVAIVISLIAGTITTSAGSDTQSETTIPAMNGVTSGRTSAARTIDAATASQVGSTVACR